MRNNIEKLLSLCETQYKLLLTKTHITPHYYVYAREREKFIYEWYLELYIFEKSYWNFLGIRRASPLVLR